MSAQHPTPQAVRALCEAILEAFAAYPASRLDMKRHSIHTDQGTVVTSLAGWYYLRTCGDYVDIRPQGLFSRQSGQRLPFEPALRQFAGALGFASPKALTTWAARNPRLWGNDRGAYALTSMRAYSILPIHLEKQPIHAATSHWLAVASRINGRYPQR